MKPGWASRLCIHTLIFQLCPAFPPYLGCPLPLAVCRPRPLIRTMTATTSWTCPAVPYGATTTSSIRSGVSCEGKGWQIKDMLLERNVDVWTYFSGWASLKDDKPPMFRTTISGVLSKCYESETWEEAEDKHRRVLEKIRTNLPRRDGVEEA